MEAQTSLDQWFTDVLERHEERTAALESAYIALKNSGSLSKVTVHKYQCTRGCQIAVVFKISNFVLCAVRDYKYSPGLNVTASVPDARKKNTLDGDLHWPGHVYDVKELERFSAGEKRSGMGMNCRHYRGTVLAADVLTLIKGIQPGHPEKPTRLGVMTA